MICTTVRLVCALQYFCQAFPKDLVAKFGVSYLEIILSVWFIVDAVNMIDEWNTKYPLDEDQQQKMAKYFDSLHSIGSENCDRYIDRQLIWIQ